MGVDSQRVPRPTERFNVLSWKWVIIDSLGLRTNLCLRTSSSIKWMVSIRWVRLKSSWRPIVPTRWIQRWCVPVDWTERLVGTTDIDCISIRSLFCIEIPLPNEQARLDILKIHAAPIAKRGDIGNRHLPYSRWPSLFLLSVDYEAIVKLSDGFNGADMRNVCTEAGKVLFSMFLLRNDGAFLFQGCLPFVLNEITFRKMISLKRCAKWLRARN